MQRKLFLLACFFVSLGCFAQQYPFVYYTPRDGLVNIRVRNVKQDSYGRLYFLTYGGLSVYDGTRFTNYTTQEGLANEVMNDIIELAPDSFLVATNTSRVNTLINGKVGLLKTTTGFMPTVNQLHRSPDGKIYAVSDEGLFLLEKNNFIRIPLLANGIDIGYFLEKLVEYKNLLLILPWSSSSENRLIVFDKQHGRVTDVVGGKMIYGLPIDPGGKVWAINDDRLRMLDDKLLQKGKVSVIEIPDPEKRNLSSSYKNCHFDNAGNSWFFSRERIKLITPDNRVHIFSAEQGLQPGNYHGVFRDREGISWLFSDGDGVVKIKNTNIQIIEKKLDNMPIRITAMRNHYDTLWLFNEVDNSILRVVGDKKYSFPLKQNIPYHAIYVHGEKLYLSAPRKLLLVENKNDAHSYLYPKTIIEVNLESIGAGILDESGSLILLTRKNLDSFYLTVINNERIVYEHPLPHTVDQLAIDNKQRLWVATRNNQLLCFGLQPGTFSQYLKLLRNYSDEVSLPNPRALAIDKNNSIWVGTRHNGLYRLEIGEDKKLKMFHFSTINGLTDNFINYLVVDNENDLWVGTQSGMDKVFFQNGKYTIANISKNNNLFQNIFRIAVTNENVVWAMISQGNLLRILPAGTQATVKPPPLLFTRLQVNDSTWDNRPTTFSYRESNLSFSVASPSFIDEKAVVYSYQLKGSGSGHWSKPVSQPTFNFLNLSPGGYVLNVKAEYPEAIYPPQFASYEFSITPPWWQTWWFRVLAGLFIIGLLILGFRFYYNRKLERHKIILERKQAVEKERTRIATDMHDDLGAGLSRIKFLSETIGIKKQQQDPIEEDISKIREYSHEMINKMGEIVWALNEKNDSLKDLLSYTRAYAVEYLSQNGISCEVEMPDEFPNKFVSGEFRRNIFLSVKEALHNIVKHAQANHVKISITNADALEIIIQDDGIGFDPKKIRPFSNGLTNIHKRMKDIGGNNEVVNKQGTTIRLSAPLS